jgi:Zn-dependent metalloprotease
MCEKRSNHVCCNIIPPHILRNICEKGNALQKDLAFRALSLSAQLRGQRQILNTIAFLASTPTGVKRRNTYDARQGMTLPGDLVRGEGQQATGDTAANEAYDGAGQTYDFYSQVFQRNSLDNRGLRLDSTVHYGNGYNNAFWNGQQMIYGDGDGTLFTRFTVSVDVIAHELTHGITQHEANLVYQGQSGALNEHFSDVFGSLVKQFVNRQSAADADWLIGQGLLMPSISGVALRSLKAPGTAYDDPTLGTDPQPDHMSKFVDTEDDNGGVHINSGIPNKAFFTLAVGLGGNAWEQAGHIWYTTLLHELGPNDTFQDCANKTYKVAGDLYGAVAADKVRAAWQAVGLGIVTASGTLEPATAEAPAAEPPAAAGAQPGSAAAAARRSEPAVKPKARGAAASGAAAAQPAPAGRKTKAAAGGPKPPATGAKARTAGAKPLTSGAKAATLGTKARRSGASGARARPAAARPRPSAATTKPASAARTKPAGAARRKPAPK